MSSIKKVSVNVMDDADKKLVSTLASMGITTGQAKILLYLKDQPGAISRDIELATDMRQPEVSVATHKLIEAGWVNAEERKHEGKGRSLLVYSLCVSFDEIITKLEIKIKSDTENQIQALSKLKASVPN